MALDVMWWMLLASCFTSTSCLSTSAVKVTLQQVASDPQLFCAQLKTRGFALVTSRLGSRRGALEWLEARHDADAALVEAEFPPGRARRADVAFPRRLRRLDLAPSICATEAGEPAISDLTAELHDVAVQCLHAISEYEELPLEKLVAEVPERLDDAKEPSFLRANLYNSDGGAGPCWHVDLGLLTVMPVGSWPAMMASPFHSSVGDNAFIEELLDPERDVMVFAGTALALATAGLGYVALVHGVSAARLREGRRISLPYFLRVRRGGIIQQPPHCDGRIAGAGLYPAAVQPGADEPPMLDLLRFHRDCYGKLCSRGEVVSLEKLAGDPALGPQLRAKFYTDSQV